MNIGLPRAQCQKLAINISAQRFSLPVEADAWFGEAVEHPGSWWPVWSEWLAAHKGGEKKAPKSLGNRRHTAIEPAPGRYVKEKFNA